MEESQLLKAWIRLAQAVVWADEKSLDVEEEWVLVKSRQLFNASDDQIEQAKADALKMDISEAAGIFKESTDIMKAGIVSGLASIACIDGEFHEREIRFIASLSSFLGIEKITLMTSRTFTS